jgi:hypothetical protein
VTSNARARAKRRGTSAQERLLAWLFTTLPMFPRSRVMRSAKHVWVWECCSRPQGCLEPSTELGVTAPARL